MKKILIALIIGFALVANVFANSNNVATNATSTNSVMGKTMSALDTALASALTKASDSSGKIWDFSATAIGKAVDTVQQETPLVIEEFLTWKFIAAATPLLGWILFYICLGWVFFATRKWTRSKDYDPDECDGFYGVLGFFGRFIPILVIVITFACAWVPRFTEMAKIRFAPRVYLIEYVVETFKK